MYDGMSKVLRDIVELSIPGLDDDYDGIARIVRSLSVLNVQNLKQMAYGEKFACGNVHPVKDKNFREACRETYYYLLNVT